MRAVRFVLGVVIVLGMGSVAAAVEYRIELPEMVGDLPYQQTPETAPPAISVDLGQPLIAFQSARLELTGFHTPGYWVGDMVEDFSEHPVAGGVMAVMNTPASGNRWMGSVNFGGTQYPQPAPWNPWPTPWNPEPAPFSVSLLVQWHPSGVGGWDNWESFLADGTTDIRIEPDGVYGWGQFTTDPVIELTSVTLVINATPAPEPATLCLLAVGGLAMLQRRKK